MSTANTFTQILNILISLIFTQRESTVVSPALISGVAIVMVFTAVYAILKTNKGILPALDKALGCAPKPLAETMVQREAEATMAQREADAKV